MIDEDMIGLALQAMVGFKVGKWDQCPIHLANAIGLTKEEWEHIKQNEDSGHLDSEDIEELDRHFEEVLSNES